jgi:hypothetical protein
VSSTQNVIVSTYIVVILVAVVLGPLIVLRGYRTWWVALFYAIFIGAAIAGGIGHYRTAQRDKES